MSSDSNNEEDEVDTVRGAPPREVEPAKQDTPAKKKKKKKKKK